MSFDDIVNMHTSGRKQMNAIKQFKQQKPSKVITLFDEQYLDLPNIKVIGRNDISYSTRLQAWLMIVVIVRDIFLLPFESFSKKYASRKHVSHGDMFMACRGKSLHLTRTIKGIQSSDISLRYYKLIDDLLSSMYINKIKTINKRNVLNGVADLITKIKTASNHMIITIWPLIDYISTSDETPYTSADDMLTGVFANTALPLRVKECNAVIFDLFSQIRNGGVIRELDSMNIIILLKFYIYSEVHMDMFEHEHVMNISKLSKLEARLMYNTQGINGLLDAASSRIELEQGICIKYNINETSVIDACVQAYVTEYIDLILSELDRMIQHDDFKALGEVYNLLLHTTDGITPIINGIMTSITTESNDAISHVNCTKNTTMYIEGLHNMYTKYMNIVKFAFSDDITIQNSIIKASSCVINNNKSLVDNSDSVDVTTRAALVLGVYTGTTIKNSRVANNGQIISDMFNMIDQKDVYIKIYELDMSRRLLSSSCDPVSEREMLGFLKPSMSGEWYSHATNMLSDIDTVDVIGNTSILVAAYGSWRALGGLALPLILPPTLQASMNIYKGKYINKYPGRKLVWKHGFGSGTLLFKVRSQTYAIACSITQITILLTLVDKPYTVAEMAAVIGLSIEQTNDALGPIVKKSIIRRSRDGNNIKINNKFKNKRRIIKITHQSKSAKKRGHRVVEEETFIDRKATIESNVIRIMKARNTITHNRLIADTVTMLIPYFKPKIRTLKRSIDSLIDKEYIERIDTGYRYIA